MKGRTDIADKGARKLWRRVMRARNDDHVASCLELATRYTQEYPNDASGWLALADTFAQMAQYEAAHRALSRAEALAPSNGREHICVAWGHFYNWRCDLRMAEKWYRRAIAHGANTHRLIFLGAVLAQQGRFAEAKRCHRRAVRLATDAPDEAYYNLGLILRAERRYAEALRCFEQAIKIDPKYSLARAARKDVLKAIELKRNG